jgi:hypothetical protein
MPIVSPRRPTPRVMPATQPITINRGHWAAQGLTGLWVFNGAATGPNAGSAPIYNEVLGNPSATISQSIQYTQNAMGPAFKMTATSGFQNLTGVGSYARAFMVPTERITILYIRSVDATDNQVSWGIEGGTTRQCKAIVPLNADNTIYWDFGGASGDNRLTASGLTWTAGKVDILGFVAGARGSAIYRNGIKVASQTVAITRTDDGTFHLNNSGHAGTCNFFAILNAEWTPSQMIEWMGDPFAMLSVPRPWLAATGGGAAFLPKIYFDSNIAVQRASSW